MVLRALLCLALVAAVGGCKQSLFDAHGEGDGPTGDGGNGSDDAPDGSVPSSCPQPCLADAAADFGMTKWRYLDDNKNRTWTPMQMMSGGYNGQGSNRISTCTNDPTAKACEALSGALLVNTTSSTAAADPALSYTSTMNQVIQISVRVHVPVSASAHTVRVYRNTREDVLFTATANPAMTFERTITLDALNSDRFYVALAPTDAGAQLIGLHVYINDAQMTFPVACQMALSFTAANGNMVSNACGIGYTYTDTMTGPQAPMLAAGPIPDLGMAADIPMDRYYEGGSIVNRSGDTTTQLWLKHDAFVSSYNAWPFSDLDLGDNTPGGLGIYIINNANPRIGAQTCTNGMTVEFVFADAPFPNDHTWHFVRVVQTGGNVHICLDGNRVASYPLPAGAMQSTIKPYVAKNAIWLPDFAVFDGAIDDVRVFTGALPCDLAP